MRKSVVASLPDRPDKRKYALEVVYHASKAFSMSLFFIYIPPIYFYGLNQFFIRFSTYCADQFLTTLPCIIKYHTLGQLISVFLNSPTHNSQKSYSRSKPRFLQEATYYYSDL